MGVAALWFIGLLVVIIDIAATVDVIRRPDAYVIARPALVDYGENREEAKKAASEAASERARDRARDLGPTDT